MSEAIHLACPQCGSVNRVPTSRSPTDAKCGKCHKPLFLRGIEQYL